MAWSRVGGNWHQVHVEYPTHFGYGERPQSVLLNGVLRTLFWGAIAFVVLPIVADAVWSVGSDAFDTLTMRPRSASSRCSSSCSAASACTCSCGWPTA